MTEDASKASGTLSDLVREFLTESDESARAYLRQGWLAAAVGALREARRLACLTQGDLAKRLGTTQSAIARMERDHEGHLSLHRYIDCMLACDAVPLDISVQPFDLVRSFTLENPAEPRTQPVYEEWLNHSTTWMKDLEFSWSFSNAVDWLVVNPSKPADAISPEKTTTSVERGTDSLSHYSNTGVDRKGLEMELLQERAA